MQSTKHTGANSPRSCSSGTIPRRAYWSIVPRLAGKGSEPTIVSFNDSMVGSPGQPGGAGVVALREGKRRVPQGGLEPRGRGGGGQEGAGPPPPARAWPAARA